MRSWKRGSWWIWSLVGLMVAAGAFALFNRVTWQGQREPGTVRAHSERRISVVANHDHRCELNGGAMRSDGSETAIENGHASSDAVLTGLEHLAAGSPASDRENQIEEVLAALIAEDPRLAVDFALALERGPTQRSVLARAAESLSQANLPEAIRWLRTLSDPALVEQALVGMAQTLVALSPPDLAKYVDQLPAGEQRTILERTLSGRLATMDLSSAVANLTGTPVDSETWQSFSQIAERWIEADPTATLRFIMEKAAGQDRADLLHQMGTLAAKHNPESALRLAGQLSDSADRVSFAAGLAVELAQRDPASAASLIGILPATYLRTEWAAHVVTRWASVDPSAAARWVEQVAAGPERDNAVRQIATRWATIDAGDATQWLSRFPESESRTALLRDVSVIGRSLLSR